MGLVRPPVLFVYGLESPVVPASMLAEIKSLNPAAEIAGIEGAGHMIPWDNLADFVTEVQRFLKETVA